MSGSGDNIPLTANGRAQAKLAGKKLKNKKVELIVCSPMIRAVDTAEIIAGELGYNRARIIKNPILLERDMGIYDGNPREKYIKDLEAKKVHGSVETEEHMYERFNKALQWLKGLEQNRIVVVSHGGARRALHVINEKLHHSKMYELESFGNGEIYEFQL
jgi:uncharacterized phosphatase